jgi:DNA-binding FrmR family transcriptional regulator
MGAVREKAAGSAHERHGPNPVNQRALRRLRNIESQVPGLQRMVEEEKYCVDILNQISAVRAALHSVGLLVVRRHVETCVSTGIEAGGTEKVEIIGESGRFGVWDSNPRALRRGIRGRAGPAAEIFCPPGRSVGNRRPVCFRTRGGARIGGEDAIPGLGRAFYRNGKHRIRAARPSRIRTRPPPRAE